MDRVQRLLVDIAASEASLSKGRDNPPFQGFATMWQETMNLYFGCLVFALVTAISTT